MTRIIYKIPPIPITFCAYCPSEFNVQKYEHSPPHLNNVCTLPWKLSIRFLQVNDSWNCKPKKAHQMFLSKYYGDL